jgi:hypothetical protein
MKQGSNGNYSPIGSLLKLIVMIKIETYLLGKFLDNVSDGFLGKDGAQFGN